jgi:hypothetical protein
MKLFQKKKQANTKYVLLKDDQDDQDDQGVQKTNDDSYPSLEVQYLAEKIQFLNDILPELRKNLQVALNGDSFSEQQLQEFRREYLSALQGFLSDIKKIGALGVEVIEDTKLTDFDRALLKEADNNPSSPTTTNQF